MNKFESNNHLVLSHDNFAPSSCKAASFIIAHLRFGFSPEREEGRIEREIDR